MRSQKDKGEGEIFKQINLLNSNKELNRFQGDIYIELSTLR